MYGLVHLNADTETIGNVVQHCAPLNSSVYLLLFVKTLLKYRHTYK